MKEKDKNKKTLAIITDSPLLQTSYSTVGQQIVDALHEEYDIDWFGFQYIGMPMHFNEFTIYSAYDEPNVRRGIEGKHYDHVIYIRNSWVFSAQKVFNPLPMFRKLSKDIIVYSPVEEVLLPKRYIADMGKSWDRLVTMTYTGQKALKEQLHTDAEVLYHAFDMPKRAVGQSKKLTLNISYSQDTRKNLLYYFILASKNPNQKFVWHGKSTYYILQDIAELYQIKNMLFTKFSTGSKDDFGFTDKSYLAQLYGMSDIYVQTSLKEGFDLTVMEALTNGLITLMPDDPLHRELFSDYTNALFVKSNLVYPSSTQLQYLMDLSDLQMKYKQTLLMKKQGFNLKDKFSIETMEKKLKEILKKGE